MNGSSNTMAQGPIIISPAEAGRLKIALPYHPGRIAKIKSVKGRRWHAEGRYWTVPRTDEAVSHLLTLFAGEPIDLDGSLGSRTDQNPEQKPETHEEVASNPALLEQVRQAIRRKHYSPKTEQAYVGWIKRFILFHRKRHPAEIAEQEIGQYLSNLATRSRVSASTQNQALNAVLFLYHEVLLARRSGTSTAWCAPNSRIGYRWS